MSKDNDAGTEQTGVQRTHELTPEEDALRIQQLKASRHSHHAAGGCADDLPKPAMGGQATAASNGQKNR